MQDGGTPQTSVKTTQVADHLGHPVHHLTTGHLNIPDSVPLEELVQVCDGRLDGVDVRQPPLHPRHRVQAHEGPRRQALVSIWIKFNWA